MSSPKVAPYGSWKSPIQSKEIAANTLKLSQPSYDGDILYWLEGRPAEGGRVVIVRKISNGTIEDVTPKGFSVRSLVHEYGGGAYIVRNGTVYFCNAADQRIYKQQLHSHPQAPNSPAINPQDIKPIAITPEEQFHFADADLDSRRNRLICVREDHTELSEPVNTLVAIELPKDDSTPAIPKIIESGHDFYSNPRVSPDGTKLAWIAWDHPNMPWDGTTMWLGDLDDAGNLSNKRQLVGADDEAIIQPEWSPNGDLYFISDRSGWWNIHVYSHPIKSIQPIQVLDAKYEFATPPWVFGLSTFVCISEQAIFCTFFDQGSWHAGLMKVNASKHTGELTRIEGPFTDISYVRAGDNRVAMCAGSPTEPIAIVEFDLKTNRWHTVKSSSDIKFDPNYISVPVAIEFPSYRTGTAHAFYYAPKNPDFQGLANELPPLMVKSHGGPSSATSSLLNPTIQYWTSRGYAVLDVNYSGSSNYGRQYRQRLTQNWGLVDLEDCEYAAKYAIKQGWVDEKRMVITGGSAGGFTTLSALTFGNMFAAGASYYGVSDLDSLMTDTHKFESRYLNRLIGPYRTHKEIYFKRSPVNFPEKLSCPVIFFHGLEDKAVPPSQTETMVEAMRKRGVPVCHITFEGEQHGFRKAENISRALDAEFLFYAKVFGFEPADELEAIPIENFATQPV